MLDWYYIPFLFLNHGFLKVTVYIGSTYHFERFVIAITWFTAMKCLCHTWQQICPVYHSPTPVLFVFVHDLSLDINLNNMTGATCWGGNAYIFTVLIWVSVVQFLVFSVVFVDHCLSSLCSFSIGQCIVCSLIFVFLLHLSVSGYNNIWILMFFGGNVC